MHIKASYENCKASLLKVVEFVCLASRKLGVLFHSLGVVPELASEFVFVFEVVFFWVAQFLVHLSVLFHVPTQSASVAAM